MSEYETPDFITDVGDDGSVRIPASYLAKAGYEAGTRVAVRITELVLSEGVRARGVTEQEVDRIGAIQRESRENVLMFLGSEGALAGEAGSAAALRAWIRSDP